MPLQSYEENEVGVGIKYKTFDDDEFIIIHSVLLDSILDDSRELATKHGKFDAAVFNYELVRAMVINYHVKNPDGTDWKLTKSTLSKVPSAFRQWIMSEIDKCDGSLAKGAVMKINGVDVTFREAA